MKRLNAKEKKMLFRDLKDEAIELRYNWQKRYRNALLCLVLSDPKWMVWVEKEIHPQTMTFLEITRLIEVRARYLVLRQYSFLGYSKIGHLIFRDDQAFTDRGNLSPG